MGIFRNKIRVVRKIGSEAIDAHGLDEKLRSS